MTLALAAIVLAVVVALAGVVAGVHGHLPPGGYAVVGLLGGLALVGAAKLLAGVGLQRPAPRSRDD